MNNLFQIKGRLTKDPQLKYTSNGLAVCEFSIAYNYKEDNKEKVNYHDITCFKELALLIAETQIKGSKVKVYARLTKEKFTNKNGIEVEKNKITAHQVDFLKSNLKEDRNKIIEEIPDSEVPF